MKPKLNYLHSKNKEKIVDVKRMLHERIAGNHPGRPLKTIHASAVTNTEKRFCPREHSIYSITEVLPVDEFLSTALNITFEYGRFIQDKINNEWLVDIMVGDWVCGVCGTQAETGKRPKIKCSCGYKKWQYKELNFVSEDCGISGGVDILLDTGVGKFTVVELKTIDKDQFKDLNAPKAEHRQRTNLYLRLIKESKHPIAPFIDTKSAIILYVSKSYGFLDHTIKEYPFKDDLFSPFKQFQIKAEHEAVDSICNLAKQVFTFRKGLTPIPEKICNSILDKRAKVCCCSKDCFSTKYPDNKYMREV